MMFTSPRYATRGIVDRVPFEIQHILWSLIKEKQKQGQALDYLQIFKLVVDYHDGEPVQKIIHSQEQPPFKSTHIYRTVSEPVNQKIWVIDSRDYVTMLFPEEY